MQKCNEKRTFFNTGKIYVFNQVLTNSGHFNLVSKRNKNALSKRVMNVVLEFQFCCQSLLRVSNRGKGEGFPCAYRASN